ncbi:hypothetical protein CKF54_03560 [Psittacicella hinzii]|uniref:Probable alginate O-acetylase AlgI n=1 Tax=Psittacicella hinzii TaxID=2028575 RepID=A0A3A1YAF1_9GAMM|nr:MBOAT family O-acyltransferase [Psittacicella hinzii]RIY33134.1 hypothetical protein CKF54_03560 [Psittacicella hinzii]
MSFFSFTFILFLFIVISIYWSVSYKTNANTAKLQNIVITLASLFFVGFIHPYFSIVLLAYAIFIHLSQRAIDKVINQRQDKNLNLIKNRAQHNFSVLSLKYFKQKSDIEELELTLTNNSTAQLTLTELKLVDSIFSSPLSRVQNDLEKTLKNIEGNEVANTTRLLSYKVADYYLTIDELLEKVKIEEINDRDLIYLNDNFNFLNSLLKNYNLIEKDELEKNYKESAKKDYSQAVPGFNFSLLIVASLLPLIYFKYYDFIYVNFVNFLTSLGFTNLGEISSVIPVLGISYYTFNSISLLISVKRGEIKSPSLLTSLTFVTYFPTIVAGPINRATTLIPQITKARCPQPINKIFFYLTLGISKKWLLATSLSMYFVQPVFGAPDNYNSWELILATYAYAFQLYFDFSGYTDLMFALGLCFGITHPINFRNPYISLNIKDFWTRWHISLSSWIRDYIYIPLGGNRHGFLLAQCYTVIAMLLSGIWHGSTLNFALWGLLHTLGIIGLNILHKVSSFRISDYSKFISRFLTFNYVCLTWIFFNSTDFDAAINFLEATFSNFSLPIHEPLAIISLVLIFIYWMLLPQVEKLINKLLTVSQEISSKYCIAICILVLWIVINLSPSGVPPFIYANF